jgi:hypothetical protein
MTRQKMQAEGGQSISDAGSSFLPHSAWRSKLRLQPQPPVIFILNIRSCCTMEDAEFEEGYDLCFFAAYVQRNTWKVEQQSLRCFIASSHGISQSNNNPEMASHDAPSFDRQGCGRVGSVAHTVPVQWRGSRSGSRGRCDATWPVT